MTGKEKARILLVDDDSTLLKFLGEFLQEEGFEVIPAESGPEALRAAYQHQPNLAILDVMMPGMDGWELTARLRELTDLPIILLSGKTAEEDKLRGFKLGIDDYVTKPFSFAELSARIASVLHRAQAAPPQGRRMLLIGDLQVDLDRREVLRNGALVALTPTEFRLLEVLARERGHAISEENLLRLVWGSSGAVDPIALRRYVYLLRQKIEPDPANPRHIITIRGYGYRLEI